MSNTIYGEPSRPVREEDTCGLERGGKWPKTQMKCVLSLGSLPPEPALLPSTLLSEQKKKKKKTITGKNE